MANLSETRELISAADISIQSASWKMEEFSFIGFSAIVWSVEKKMFEKLAEEKKKHFRYTYCHVCMYVLFFSSSKSQTVSCCSEDVRHKKDQTKASNCTSLKKKKSLDQTKTTKYSIK